MEQVAPGSFLSSFIPLAQRYAETQQDIAILLMQINNLEEIAREHGEVAKDACQAELHRQLKMIAKRSDDIVGVIDETRFAVALTHCDLVGIKNIVSDLMLDFFGDVFTFVSSEGQRYSLEARVSAGVTVHTGPKDGFSSLERAYQALRDAQSNRYSSFSALENSATSGLLHVLSRFIFAKDEVVDDLQLDSVTGLPTVDLFSRQITEALRSADSIYKPVSIIEVSCSEQDDLATFGHATLDRLAISLTDILKKLARRKGDRCFKIGSQSLACVMPLVGEEEAEKIEGKLAECLSVAVRSLEQKTGLEPDSLLAIKRFTYLPGEDRTAFKESVLSFSAPA